ncbi:MAG TPA: twin-arginine translocase TatA/TatE family subunit [Terrimicrobiaceae bacterium]|nr:twin-arginine translocase TatA/TatE family subunit [Terrimicrobiaceae bacterium]
MPGWPETIFILIVVLLLFGPQKLPELARGLAKSLGEFKKARDEFEHELRKATTEVEIKTPGNTQPHQPFPQASQGPVPPESGLSKGYAPEKPA